MMYALDRAGQVITATPGADGTCRGCGSPLSPKCGALVAHHWAHRSADCDTWAEPDNRWHLNWQSHAPPERAEVTIGAHRADMVTPDGRVVEIQHSTLAVADIQAREQHYGRMAWIFDARDAYAADRLLIRPREQWAGFRWKHPRKSISACRRPVFLDLDGEQLFRVRRFNVTDRCTGWGTLSRANDFRAWIAQPATPQTRTRHAA